MHDKEFLVISEIEKENWWFRARRELVARLIKEEKCKNILDVGCGTGGNAAYFSAFARTTGLEKNEYAASLGREKGTNVVTGDACWMPFMDGEFDAVLFLDVLEHIENEKMCLSECRRVLEQGGRIIITVPANKWMFSDYDRKLGHLRRYGKKELEGLVGKYFKVKECFYWNSIILPFEALRRRLPGVRKNASEQLRTGKVINSILYSILSFENFLAGIGLHFPFGISIILVGEKDEEKAG